jgi:AraC-like DNA-binding protein
MRAAGIDVSPYVDDAMLELDEARATARELANLLDVAAEGLAEPHVALRLPHELVYRRYDAVALASAAAKTPEEVLGVHERWGRLVFPQLEGAVRETRRGEIAVIAFEANFRGYPRGLGVRVDEYLLALLLHRCRRGGARLAPTRVMFSASRPRDIAPLIELFGTDEIAFGAERLGFELTVSDARQLLTGGDSALMGTAEQLASSALNAAPRTGALRESVAARIESKLPAVVSPEDVAAMLHMSARTLQRRLESEGTRFSEVLDRVRERHARRLLMDPSLGLAEIAYRAGFADLATFSRAFKRWTGIPPGAFRRRND